MNIKQNSLNMQKNIEVMSYRYLEIDNESSEKIGKYIGWQIVKSYMNNNDVSLTELLITSPTDIYNKSKYKPNK